MGGRRIPSVCLGGGGCVTCVRIPREFGGGHHPGVLVVDTGAMPSDPDRPRRILVAEDDSAVRESLEIAFRYEGYDVAVAPDGGEALAAIGEVDPELIVLDVNMPVVDGLSVCRTLRSRGDRTPVLLLTARVEVSDRVEGLDAGADDYLPKPFSLEELLARVRALLRRTAHDEPGEVLTVDDLVLEPAARRARRGSTDIELTKTEYDLLELLMENAGIVLTREVIYDRIWGFDFETTSRSLDVYISYLRRKTEVDDGPRLIHTVRGVGFTLRAP